jgi:colicin import membrane protein
MKRLAVLVAAALFALPSLVPAEDTAPPPAAGDKAAMQAEARRLHDEADETRNTAETEYAKAQKECWRKFLVSKCLDETGQTYRNEKAKANALDSHARSIERELKRREVAEKEAKRIEKEGAKAQQ